MTVIGGGAFPRGTGDEEVLAAWSDGVTGSLKLGTGATLVCSMRHNAPGTRLSLCEKRRPE